MSTAVISNGAVTAGDGEEPKPKRTRTPRVPPEAKALGGDVSNAAEDTILMEAPYDVQIRVTGDADLLFRRWQSEEVEIRGNAPKGSALKKTDNAEAAVWRDKDGHLCLPGEYMRGSICNAQNGAAKYQQDPRSPRKSMLDLFKAGLISLTPLAPIVLEDGTVADHWDYLDRRRVTIQRSSGITRVRPAFNAGWSAEFVFRMQLPQYIPPRTLHRTFVDGGRLVGVGDFRPTFGRFSVTHFEVLSS